MPRCSNSQTGGSVLLIVLLVLLSCSTIFVGSAPSAPVPDAFMAAGPAKAAVGGYLGRRIAINTERRLLRLNLDSILEPFVHRPGVQEWVGEHAGKFLDAASLAWEQTHDPRLRVRMDKVARTLIACQKPDGYLGTYLDKNRWTSWDVWSHKYCLIGLLSYHRVTGSKAALEACRGAADLLCATFGPGKRDIIRSGTHMGMAPTSVLEPMARLYGVTGDERYLTFCRYLVQAWDEPNGPKILSSLLARGSVRRTANAKAYEMMSNLVGLLELYRQTGEPTYLRACTNAWKDIVAHQDYAISTASWGEHFQDDDRLRVDAEQQGDSYVAAGEGCVTVTWEQLNLQLFRLTGEAKYADELERLTYNALLAAQSPRDGTVCYFLPMNGRKAYGEVNHGIKPDICCCSSSIPRGIALIPGFSLGSINSQPTIVLYAPADRRVMARGADGAVTVGLQVRTDYPRSGHVRVVVRPQRRATFALRLRVPAWCDRFTAKVGPQVYAGRSGQWLDIKRTWVAGDTVEVDMDLPIFTVPQGKDHFVAIERGPQVLALDHALMQAGKIPEGWTRTPTYEVRGRQGEKPRRLLLIPIAEAGQSKADYEAAFRDFQLDKPKAGKAEDVH